MRDDKQVRALIHGEPLQEGTRVRTPSGRLATVIEPADERGEATVEWIADGERARFKTRHLHRAGEA